MQSLLEEMELHLLVTNCISRHLEFNGTMCDKKELGLYQNRKGVEESMSKSRVLECWTLP